MKWVTCWHVHVDGSICPLLISKLVDKTAELVFIPWSGPLPSWDLSATFDFPSSYYELGHHDGKRTFEAIIETYHARV
ncbi:MAG: chromate resistance protein ChrB domain-containing protein [Candidatus Bathyarchaeia archaeon]